MYEPVRTAAASARERMVKVAAEELGVSEYELVTRKGAVIAPDGRRLSYGSLAEKAAVETTQIVKPRLKRLADLQFVGKDQRRTDARAAVTGTKVFAMDLEVPNALPTMVCRPPTINGTGCRSTTSPRSRRCRASPTSS